VLFGATIAAAWVMIEAWVGDPAVASAWPGVAGVVQTACLLLRRGHAASVFNLKFTGLTHDFPVDPAV
jgi:hypothetical protein